MSTFELGSKLRERWPDEELVARAGIALGLFAFVVALPSLSRRVSFPPAAREAWWPALIGVVAIAAGIWAVSRRVTRLGWTAVGFGIVGIGLGVLTTRASEGNLEQVVVWSALLSAALVWATPLTFAAIGGMFAERSGVTNIGLEGMMLSGAFFGVLGADKLGSWELGLVLAMIAGGGFALVHAFMSIPLRADQFVSGTAVNFFALGLTGYFFLQPYRDNG